MGAQGLGASNLRQASFNRRKTQRQAGDLASGKWSQDVVKTPPFKKGRMTWSPQLHRDFLASLTAIGLRAAVPKTIMQVRSKMHAVPDYF
jgi:SHAQKYF class myb-like DNA-binding protein